MKTLRPYQCGAIEWLSKRRRGLVVSPAGSGKTIIAAGALAKVIHSRPRTAPVKIGWLANTTEQCDQAFKAMLSVFLDIEVPTSEARARWEVEKHRCKLASLKVACAAAATDWGDRDVLVVDEAHHGNAAGWCAQISACQGARWGFTATPPEDPIQSGALAELLGPSFTISRDQVQRSLAPAVVTWLDATDPNLQQPIEKEIERVVKIRSRYWPGDKDQLWGQVAWQVCVEMGIVANRARNAAAVSAATNNKPTLVLVNQVEHGKVLASLIPGAHPCWSAMGAKARREALDGFVTGKARCLVATSLADEGIDLPNAEVLVLVSAGKSSSRTEQRTGRVLREFAGKSHAHIFDFRDNYHPLPAKHARLREELYRKLGYKMT